MQPAPTRIWLTGEITVRRVRKEHWLIQVLNAAAAAQNAEVDRWQRSKRLRDVRCCQMRWHDQFSGAVTAAVAVSGSGRRVQWAVCADAEHGWVPQSESPVRRVGLLSADTALEVVCDPSGLPSGNAGMMLAPEDRDFADEDVAASVAGSLTDPARSVGVLVGSVAQFKTQRIERVWARLDEAQWPGLLAVVLASPDGRQELNGWLGQQPIPAQGGARYFPPPGELGNQVLAAEEFHRSERIQALVAAALASRAGAVPPVLASCAADVLPEPRPTPAPLVPAVSDSRADPATLQSVRRELAAATDSNAELEQRVEQLRQQCQALRAERDQARDEVAALRHQPAARELLAEVKTLRARNEALQAEVDLWQEANDDTEADRDRLRVQVSVLMGRLGKLDPAAAAEPTDAPDITHGSFEELLAAPFPDVQITAELAPALRLDADPKAAIYRRKTLIALRTLSAYAQAKRQRRREGQAAGPEMANVLSFLQSQHPGGLISARLVSLTESETVVNSARFSSERVFRVPPEVEPTGEAMFVSHIRIGSGRNLAPRLHFLDDTDGVTGKVYVGYVGPHLPNTKTN